MTVVKLDNFRTQTVTSELFFPVELVEMTGTTQRGQQIVASNHRAVVRTDTNEVLAIHGKDYKLVANEDIYTAFDQALQHSQLDLTGMTVTDSLSHGGARSFRKYVFPNHEYTIGSNNDKIQLQLAVVNSYDGSTAFSAIVGAFRLLCSNGLIVGDKWAQTYGRHTSQFDPELAVKKMTSALDTYCENVTEWQSWVGQKISDDEAAKVIHQIPNLTPKMYEKIWHYWQQEQKSLGPTKWALFNALTFWSTHEETKKPSQENLASVQFQRESRVRTVLNRSAVFKKAA